MNKNLKNILLIFITIILFFIIFEILTRSLNLVVEINDASFNKLSKNPILFYELIPNSTTNYMDSLVKINSHGLRDYEYSFEKPEDTFRIIVLGDSMVFGFGLNIEDTFPKILEKNLNEFDFNKKYEVLNFGVIGYNTMQEIEVLKEKALEYDPDLIIIGYIPWDAECPYSACGDELIEYTNVAYSKTYIHRELSEAIKKSSFLRLLFFHYNGLLYNLGFASYDSDAVSFLYKKDSPTWDSIKKSFNDIKAISEENNIPAVLLIYPEVIMHDFNPYGEIHKQIKIEGIRNGFYVMDLYSIYKNVEDKSSMAVFPPEKFKGFYYDDHPSALANELISNETIVFLQQNKLI